MEDLERFCLSQRGYRLHFTQTNKQRSTQPPNEFEVTTLRNLLEQMNPKKELLYKLDGKIAALTEAEELEAEILESEELQATILDKTMQLNFF